MKFTYTDHAESVLASREIRREWVARVVNHPELITADESDATLKHRLGRIKEFGNRVLRVIINTELVPPRVVTAFFDRSMKGQL